MAGYVDGGLGAAELEQFERHLADCPHCLELVGVLCRERGPEATAREPAKSVPWPSRRSESPNRRAWRFAPQWAAAAALVLVVPVLLQLGSRPDGGAGGQGRPDPPATRALAPGPFVLEVVAERPDTSPDARRPSFRWSEVAGSQHYDVRIVTDAGDVVIEQRVTGTTWRTPANLGLRPGAEYFVHVEAYPTGDKPLSLGHVPFRVGTDP